MNFILRAEGIGEFKPPSGFLEEFKSIVAGVYPQKIIARLRADNYNPVIIGYEHDKSEFVRITAKLTPAITSFSQKPKIALELFPKQVGWIEDFLRYEKEFKEHGTVNGEESDKDTPNSMRSYRDKLLRLDSEHLALWLLEREFKIIAIEHNEVVQWIENDKKRALDDSEDWLGTGLSYATQPGYTAIRRDIYGLKVIDKERPDIIVVGLNHALKYDFLLGRDGKNSFYFYNSASLTNSWSSLLNMWRTVHKIKI